MTEDDYQNEWLQLSSNDMWLYNKLELSTRLHYKCGPVGIDVPSPGWYIVRPCVNLIGLGLGATKEWLDKSTDHLPIGYFWCEWFTGTHYSIDFENGNHVRTTIGIRDSSDLTKWKKWLCVGDRVDIPYLILDSNLHYRYPNMNIEFIGNKLIEVHLRKNPDFSYNNTVFIPVWYGDTIDPPVGHKYIECPDVNGRIGAYIDIT